MKKSKILLPLLGIVSMSGTIVPIVSCSNSQKHVWLEDTDEPIKDADENLSAKYYFGLDSNYKTDDIKVEVSSENKDYFGVKHIVSNNVAIVTVTCIQQVEEKTGVEFTLKFTHANWTQEVSGLTINIEAQDPADLKTLKQINKILSSQTTPCKTMYQALQACKPTIDVEQLIPTVGTEYVWDQSVNQFIIINSLTGDLVYSSKGYELNQNKWQLWKMVYPSSYEGSIHLFSSDCEYAQYIKQIPEAKLLKKSNASVRLDVKVISGFDCGEYTDEVEAVEYNKVDDNPKDNVIIRTNSYKSNVSINALNKTSEGDLVDHYGKMGGLALNSNYEYVEYGEALTANISQGSITVDTSASSEASVKVIEVEAKGCSINVAESATTTQVLTTSNEIASETTGTTPTVKTEEEIAEAKKEVVEEEGGTLNEPILVYDATGNTVGSYKTLTALSAASNDSQNPEYFENKIVKITKDMDMTSESSTWVPICNFEDDTGVKAFKGTIDGQEHTISNFNLSVTSGNPGLINSNAGSVKNLNFKDCSLSNTGGRICLVAVWNGAGNMEFDNLNFYNCNVTSARSNGFAMGYILNSGTTAKITNCYTDEQCWAKGTGTSVVQTGFISQACNGVDSLIFEDCEMHLNVSSYYAAAGYVGQLGAVGDAGVISTTFKNCTSYGVIKMIEGSSGNGPMVGGFVGARQNNAQTSTSPTTTVFDHCTNYSKVYSEDRYSNIDSLGGFIGYGNSPKDPGTTVSFIDCVNEGEIGKENTGTSYTPNYAGGFFGRTNGNENITITFTRCENKGYINATTAGHFMGLLDITSAAALAARKCVDCTISGSLRDGATRTQITGEPNQ